MKFLLLTFVVMAQVSYGATIETSSRALRAAVNEAQSLLPSDFLDSVKSVVRIEAESFKSDGVFGADLCNLDKNVKFGFTKKNKITISQKLIELAQSNRETFDCGHGSFQKMLTAVLIHELTHVKDNVEKISVMPDFQRIVGVKKVQKNSKKKLMNQNVEASPDAYEFENLEESLAVNVEYMMLDPEFECRKPATANFLAKKLNYKLPGTCERTHKVLAQSAYLEDNYQLSVSIDPKRIYQVHYLFAGKGQSLMSRWGHAMFRLVVCAPFRKVAGPECLNDVSHHLALSYRAYMSDINISYSKGMFGKYPSQLFIMRYLEVQQEYTKSELRDLYSVPLKMTSEQKKEFLDLTLERFWTYQGKYYFLDNNCGTETVKHLKVALSEEESGLIHSVTPLKIYNDIVKKSNDLTSGDSVKIESMYQDLNETYKFLKRYMPSFREKDIKKFLKKTTASARLNDYERFVRESASMEKVEKGQVAMKLVYLERYLANRYLLEIPKKAIAKMNKDEDLKAQVMKMGESLKLLGVQPWEVVKASYGVPTHDEFETEYPRFLEGRKSAMKESLESQMMNLDMILGKKYFENELREIENLKIIKRLTQELIANVNNLI